MKRRCIHWRRVAVVSLVLAALVGCDRQVDATDRAERATTLVHVKVAPVRVGALDRVVEVVGTLYGDEEVTVSAKVPGRIVRLSVDVGDRVDGGAELARIDPTDYKLLVEQRDMALRQALAELGLEALPDDQFDIMTVPTVERARFQAANAKAKMERAKRLFEQQPPLISEQDFQDLETAWQVAQRNHDVAALEARSQLALARSRASELDAARQRLSDATVRAPGSFAGGATTDEAVGRYAVAGRLITQGEYVREGDALFRLVSDDPIKFRAAVPERHVSDVRVGQTVTLRVEGRGQPYTGKIARINPAIDINTRTFQVEALLENADRALRPGAFVRATVRIGEENGITFVPREAIVSFAGTDKLFTVAEGKAIEHRITLLSREGEQLPVRETIEGEVVITNTGQLAEGVAVEVQPREEGTADARG